jgi:hypothetical protein
MLRIIARPVNTEGIGFEKPSVYFNPIAQQTSINPAIVSKIQDIQDAPYKFKNNKERRLVLTGYGVPRPEFYLTIFRLYQNKKYRFILVRKFKLSYKY